MPTAPKTTGGRRMPPSDLGRRAGVASLLRATEGDKSSPGAGDVADGGAGEGEKQAQGSGLRAPRARGVDVTLKPLPQYAWPILNPLA